MAYGTTRRLQGSFASTATAFCATVGGVDLEACTATIVSEAIRMHVEATGACVPCACRRARACLCVRGALQHSGFPNLTPHCGAAPAVCASLVVPVTAHGVRSTVYMNHFCGMAVDDTVAAAMPPGAGPGLAAAAAAGLRAAAFTAALHITVGPVQGTHVFLEPIATLATPLQPPPAATVSFDGDAALWAHCASFSEARVCYDELASRARAPTAPSAAAAPVAVVAGAAVGVEAAQAAADAVAPAEAEQQASITPSLGEAPSSGVVASAAVAEEALATHAPSPLAAVAAVGEAADAVYEVGHDVAPCPADAAAPSPAAASATTAGEAAPAPPATAAASEGAAKAAEATTGTAAPATGLLEGPWPLALMLIGAAGLFAFALGPASARSGVVVFDPLVPAGDFMAPAPAPVPVAAAAPAVTTTACPAPRPATPAAAATATRPAIKAKNATPASARPRRAFGALQQSADTVQEVVL